MPILVAYKSAAVGVRLLNSEDSKQTSNLLLVNGRRSGLRLYTSHSNELLLLISEQVWSPPVEAGGSALYNPKTVRGK